MLRVEGSSVEGLAIAEIRVRIKWKPWGSGACVLEVLWRFRVQGLCLGGLVKVRRL